LEAELGRIRGVEDDVSVDESAAGLADPDQAVEFCEALALTAFAPAIGTAHGVYRGEPEVRFDLLEEIATRTGLPIALHGGTGLSDEVFRRCIGLGVAKVNISTQLKYAFLDGFCQHHRQHGDYDPLKALAAQFERVKREMAANMELFASAGRAGDVDL
jgi:fructose/tagatose bisphosphate aldolase